jgi:hypothetical protein
MTRGELVLGLASALGRLAQARALLTDEQALYLAEEFRTLADEFDRGRGERLRHQVRCSHLVLLNERGPNGRPLYRAI